MFTKGLYGVVPFSGIISFTNLSTPDSLGFAGLVGSTDDSHAICRGPVEFAARIRFRILGAKPLFSAARPVYVDAQRRRFTARLARDVSRIGGSHAIVVVSHHSILHLGALADECSIRSRAFAWLAAVACAGLAIAGARQKTAPATVVPVPRDGGWMQRHESFNERVKKGNVDLLLIGDSITQGWEGAGKEAWEKHYGKRNAMNLGIGGDRTQHVLWRLDHGNIDGISPKLAVLMIGTNNSNGTDNTAEEIGAGIEAIVKKLRDEAAADQGADSGHLPPRRKAEPAAREERQGQRDRLEAGRQQDGLLPRHRRQVSDGRRHADQGNHARLSAPEPARATRSGPTSIEPKVQQLMGEK